MREQGHKQPGKTHPGRVGLNHQCRACGFLPTSILDERHQNHQRMRIMKAIAARATPMSPHIPEDPIRKGTSPVFEEGRRQIPVFLFIPQKGFGRFLGRRGFLQERARRRGDIQIPPDGGCIFLGIIRWQFRKESRTPGKDQIPRRNALTQPGIGNSHKILAFEKNVLLWNFREPSDQSGQTLRSRIETLPLEGLQGIPSRAPILIRAQGHDPKKRETKTQDSPEWDLSTR